MRFLEKQIEVIVRSRISTKRLTRPLSMYIKYKKYQSLLDYLINNQREYVKRGMKYDIAKISRDEETYLSFVKEFVHPEYSISFEKINKPIYVVSAYKKGVPIFLFSGEDTLPKTSLAIVNDILFTYGTVNGKRKYIARSFIKNN